MQHPPPSRPRLSLPTLRFAFFATTVVNHARKIDFLKLSFPPLPICRCMRCLASTAPPSCRCVHWLSGSGLMTLKMLEWVWCRCALTRASFVRALALHYTTNREACMKCTLCVRGAVTERALGCFSVPLRSNAVVLFCDNLPSTVSGTSPNTFTPSSLPLQAQSQFDIALYHAALWPAFSCSTTPLLCTQGWRLSDFNLCMLV